MGGETKTIVVVDDEPQVRGMLESYLSREGFVTTGASSGEMLRTILSRTPADLVIVDVMLPGESGFDIVRQLRQSHPEIGIIMLTAKGDEIDRVVGLEMGADDYVAKPFSLREVSARVKSVLRRAPRTALPSPGKSHQVVRFDRWILDFGRHRLSSDGGEEVQLSPGEYVLLRAMVEHPGRVLSRETLLELTHGYSSEPLDRAIDVQVARLRQKIEVNPRTPEIIRTVRGGGYTFAAAISVS